MWFFRHALFLKINLRKKNQINKKQKIQQSNDFDLEANSTTTDNTILLADIAVDNQIGFADTECQVDFLQKDYNQTSTFTCVKFIREGFATDVEVETEIPIVNKVVFVPNQKVLKNKSCCTNAKVFSDKSKLKAIQR